MDSWKVSSLQLEEVVTCQEVSIVVDVEVVVLTEELDSRPFSISHEAVNRKRRNSIWV